MLKSLFCKIGIHKWKTSDKKHVKKAKCEKCGKVVPKWYVINRGL